MGKIHLKEITETVFIQLGDDGDYGGWAWLC